MSYYRISTIAKLLGVSTDTVRRWLEDGLIASAPEKNTGPTRICGKSVVKFIQNKPDFQQLHTGLTGQQSIRNHLEGLITKIISDRVMSQVELQCGPFRMVSLISTEAVKELDLKVGSVAVAQVKATNLSIGLLKGEKL